ncbi:gamma-glutamylcyclotransferase [Vibrio sp. SM6]|uniref:Gamma-glutamylcyclotransferase family protein n=1 Tax=Vibrio agarilyticus TaxID=2726741 RepID=A0A7X8TPN7_9VIBR|nr:gamma-glutamylcyclotransferase [Vibrio agarilyticus]NLS12419.1 gamma-glutamylcyclotransferase [Vibrio agarilyticus]
MITKGHRVFVYGTLRRGESNHHYLQHCQKLGEWRTPPCYTLFDLGPYPALVLGTHSIFGEVYQVDEQTLVALDELEDVPLEYRRAEVITPFGAAWIYLYQNEQALSKVIPSGDWCQRREML